MRDFGQVFKQVDTEIKRKGEKSLQTRIALLSLFIFTVIFLNEGLKPPGLGYHEQK